MLFPPPGGPAIPTIICASLPLGCNSFAKRKRLAHALATSRNVVVSLIAFVLAKLSADDGRNVNLLSTPMMALLFLLPLLLLLLLNDDDDDDDGDDGAHR